MPEFSAEIGGAGNGIGAFLRGCEAVLAAIGGGEAGVPLDDAGELEMIGPAGVCEFDEGGVGLGGRRGGRLGLGLGLGG